MTDEEIEKDRLEYKSFKARESELNELREELDREFEGLFEKMERIEKRFDANGIALEPPDANT